eukprot:1194003-Prorocentrum_minimum.AAC.1
MGSSILNLNGTDITSSNQETTHGYKSVASDTENHPESAVRCFSDRLGIGASVPNQTSVDYQTASAVCDAFVLDGNNDWRLPRTVNEVGSACGTGYGYDANIIWMDKSFHI